MEDHRSERAISYRIDEKMATQKSCIQCGHLFRFFHKKMAPHQIDIPIYVPARLKVMSRKIIYIFVPKRKKNFSPLPKKKGRHWGILNKQNVSPWREVYCMPT